MPEWVKILLSVIIGGAIVVGGNFLLELYQRDQARNNLMSAFIGDIRAMQAIEQRREIKLQSDMECLKEQEDKKSESCRPWINPEEPLGFIVFETNAGQLGLLKEPLPSMITEFYALSEQLRSQLILLYGEPIPDANRDHKLRHICDHQNTRKAWHELAYKLLMALGGEKSSELTVTIFTQGKAWPCKTPVLPDAPAE